MNKLEPMEKLRIKRKAHAELAKRLKVPFIGPVLENIISAAVNAAAEVCDLHAEINDRSSGSFVTLRQLEPGESVRAGDYRYEGGLESFTHIDWVSVPPTVVRKKQMTTYYRLVK